MHSQAKRATPTSFRRKKLNMETLIQQLINGLVIGSVYALIALGYTMELLAKRAV